MLETWKESWFCSPSHVGLIKEGHVWSFFGGHVHALKVIWSCLNLPEIQVKVANSTGVWINNLNLAPTYWLAGQNRPTKHTGIASRNLTYELLISACVILLLVEASFLKQMFMILGGKAPVFPHYANVSKYWVLKIQLVFNHLKKGFPWGDCERSTMVNATEYPENKYLKIYHWRNLAHITSHLPISIYVSSHLNCSIPKPAKVWNQSKPNLASLTGGSATR